MASPCYIKDTDDMDNKITVTEAEVAGVMSTMIGVIMVVVMLMYGVRQVRRTVRGEPIEPTPLMSL